MYESPKKFVPKFFDNTSTSYDKIVKYCTFGKDKFWKNEIIQQISKGQSFLDLACGTGILTRKIAEKFPSSSVIGIDITESYLKVAKKNSSNYKNIYFLHNDAETINFSQKFDCVTASYLPKYCNPRILVKKCAEHIKQDGKIIFHDFSYPKNRFVRAFWEMYFVLLNFVGYFISNWKEAFVNLPKLIKSSNWIETYENEFRKIGFDIKHVYLTWNSSAILVATKF